MSIDWQSNLIDPIYDVLGVPARLTTSTTVKDITVLDKTAGVALAAADNVEIQTVKPAAIVRMSELSSNGLSRDNLQNAKLTFIENTSAWVIKATQPKPSPAGEARGELYLFLEAA